VIISNSGGSAHKGGHLKEIVYRSISSMVPNPRNPRRHSDKQIRQLARSIEAFRFNVPVLVACNSEIVRMPVHIAPRAQ